MLKGRNVSAHLRTEEGGELSSHKKLGCKNKDRNAKKDV